MAVSLFVSVADARRLPASRQAWILEKGSNTCEVCRTVYRADVRQPLGMYVRPLSDRYIHNSYLLEEDELDRLRLRSSGPRILPTDAQGLPTERRTEPGQVDTTQIYDPFWRLYYEWTEWFLYPNNKKLVRRLCYVAIGVVIAAILLRYIIIPELDVGCRGPVEIDCRNDDCKDGGASASDKKRGYVWTKKYDSMGGGTPDECLFYSDQQGGWLISERQGSSCHRDDAFWAYARTDSKDPEDGKWRVISSKGHKANALNVRCRFGWL